MNIYNDRFQSPLGEIQTACTDLAVIGLWFIGQKWEPDPPWGERYENHPLLRQLRQEAEEYLNKRRSEFTLPLEPRGTPFQCLVWNKLREIPYGKTVTYAQLATSLGDHNKARAVGAAVGRNPISILIPCHRVIGADGSLTGYAGGIARKQDLLRLESETGEEREQI